MKNANEKIHFSPLHFVYSIQILLYIYDKKIFERKFSGNLVISLAYINGMEHAVKQKERPKSTLPFVKNIIYLKKCSNEIGEIFSEKDWFFHRL